MSELRDSNVLVTGGAGFIGSNLVEHLLNNNNKVICFDNFSTGKKENIRLFRNNKNFVLIIGDIRNYKDCMKACKNVEIVFHQAALGSVPRSIKDPIKTNDVNIGGFVNMLFAANNSGVRRFIYAGSSSTYGDHPKLPKVEDKIGKPLSPYAITKYVNELYAENFASIYGIEVIGLRYFNVFGKRQDPNSTYAAVIPKFIKSLLMNKSPLINGDGTHSRDYTYCKNVVTANILAATTKNAKAINTVYNIACGKRTNLSELFKIIRMLLAEKKPSIAKIEPNYGPERKGDVIHSLASIEKARKLLGYEPEYYIEKGLQKTIEWYLQKK